MEYKKTTRALKIILIFFISLIIILLSLIVTFFITAIYDDEGEIECDNKEITIDLINS